MLIRSPPMTRSLILYPYSFQPLGAGKISVENVLAHGRTIQMNSSLTVEGVGVA